MGALILVTAAPFNSTLMGMLRGVMDCFGIGVSDATLYGGTGHAFMINIHRELCPSGPYCWERGPLVEATERLGVRINRLGFFDKNASAEARAKVEGALVAQLDRGLPCGLINLEWQVVSGYDEAGFVTSQPWKGMNFPPGRLSFGSWAEFGQQVHVDFCTFEKVAPAGRRRVVVEALRYGADIWANPSRHSGGAYAAGRGAYENWVTAVKAGHGSGHGNWWNATVWAECRRRAAEFLGEVGGEFPEAAEACAQLGKEYAAIAAALGEVADKKGEASRKLELLEDAMGREERCVRGLEEVAGRVGEGG